MTSRFVFDWILGHAQATPHAPAIGAHDGWITYAELARRTLSLAHSFASHGVRSGDRVIVALPNVPATVAVPLALKALGAISVEVNREYGDAAIRDAVSQVGARHGVLYGPDAARWGDLFEMSVEHLWVVSPSRHVVRMIERHPSTGATWVSDEGELEARELADPACFVRDLDAPALIAYTSGSTGRPRGVVLTHRNLDANTRSIVEYLGLTADDRALLTLPLFYCYGRSVVRTHLKVGGSVFLGSQSVYPHSVTKALVEHRATGFPGVPFTFELLRRHKALEHLVLPHLRYVTQAGGPMSPDLMDWVRSTFAPAPLFVMYGQTEATARLTYLRPERMVDKRGSVGQAIQGVTLKVVDGAGRELAAGEPGHIVARGDNIMSGYWRAPEESAAVLRGGWLWTGDLGYQDAEGFLFITGRTKEMLKIAGHRVSALEIEHVLLTHGEVREVAVVGTPDALGGEAIHAFVVRAPGSALTAKTLQAHARERGPAFMVPRLVTFLESLPRSRAGKVQKGELMALFAQLAATKETAMERGVEVL